MYLSSGATEQTRAGKLSARLLCSSIDCIILLLRLCNIIIINIHNKQRYSYLQLCYKDIVISLSFFVVPLIALSYYVDSVILLLKFITYKEIVIL